MDDTRPIDRSAFVQPPLVVPVILNWNRVQLTLETLASLQEQTHPRIQTIVLDNGSDDQEEALDRIRSAHPEVRLMGSRRNLGFAGGCNTGMREALSLDPDYLLLLNNDVSLHPDAISELVAALEADPSAGAAGPLIYYASQPERIWFGGGDMLMGRRVLAQHGEDLDVHPNSPTRECDWLPATALMVSRSAVERAGPMDRSYFLYWEDVDWCYRLRRAKYKLLFVPHSVVWHKVNATSGSMPMANVYYWERNRLRFIERWGTWKARFFAWGKILWRSIAWRIKPPSEDPQAHTKLEAYRDYLLRRSGKWREREHKKVISS